jgi:uncharacterized protein (TIGR02145 family)
MKRAIYTLFAVLVSLAVLADVPQSFNYQAVLRDAEGQVMSEQNVKVDISILQGSAEGEPVLIETHNTSTNAFGLINLMIGSVTSLETIDWNDGPYFIQINVNDIEMGTSQLLSVPYSLFSLQSADAFSGNYEDLANLPDLEGLVQLAEDPQTGDMIFFNGTKWEKIPMGVDGDFLQISNNAPKWLPLGGVADIDGNIYNTVRIGDQEWLDRNLMTIRYQNGDSIPGNFSNEEWKELSIGAYAIVPDSLLVGLDSPEEVKEAYGLLYNFYAVEDPRGICPPGFRVATKEDWKQLHDNVVADGVVSNMVTRALKSCRVVDSPLGGDCATSEHPRWAFNATFFGTDDYGFGYLPNMYRNGADGSWPAAIVGFGGYFWTGSSSADGTQGIYRFMLAQLGMLMPETSITKNMGNGVRCIKE